MGSAQHLGPSARILLALSEDAASPEVQVWALHALVTKTQMKKFQKRNVFFVLGPDRRLWRSHVPRHGGPHPGHHPQAAAPDPDLLAGDLHLPREGALRAHHHSGARAPAAGGSRDRGGYALDQCFLPYFFSFFSFFQSVLLSCAPAPCCRAIPTL